MNRRGWLILTITLCAGIAYTFSLPERLFDIPYSTVLHARDGRLLHATIARDGQWRFPLSERVPRRFSAALVAFEDKRFYWHPGVDPLAMGRALVRNVSEKKIVSGGSTITMQVIRLSRGNRPRTFGEKILEVILATRLEWKYSKEEILSLYAAHAPFGGNVAGLEAACWRYFGRSPDELSWSEASLLAVLPNAPSLMHPGRNRDALKRKRNRLLDRLLRQGQIDSLTCELGKAEPVPAKPLALPASARHLLARMKKEGGEGKRLVSTIDYTLQQRVEEKLQNHHDRLRANHIFNGAVLILDVRSGKTLAYAGNVRPGKSRHGEEVDIITSPRSTGSILKPFLYAAALDEGLILPRTLLPDIPVFMDGFAPQNFSRQYDGVVHADNALVRSLNVPAVFLLREYRYEKFHTLLKNIGMTTLTRPPDHYGLSLILGGAEGTLWDITAMYASMGRTLRNYFEHPGSNRYVRADFRPASFAVETPALKAAPLNATSWLSAASIFLTFEKLRELYRPHEESGWQYFNSSGPVAWKTGTSFGFRDGWAIGVTPDYAVGVWIGNADGEGRPGLTGTNAAAPLLFDIFSLLGSKAWFERPASELVDIPTCRQSGYRASAFCANVDTVQATVRGRETSPCPYHRLVHLSDNARFQVHSGCEEMSSIRHEKWFVLPPIYAHYYRSKNISYRPLPPFRDDCRETFAASSMALIYPKADARIFIPRDFDGKPGGSVFELAHNDGATTVFWHLDGAFIGTTRGTHKLAVSPAEGSHVLTLIDARGEVLEETFVVITAL